jgi:L-2-hydroxyglutarate oxidase LhgO
MNKNASITIIGGGVVGCAVAYTFTKNRYKNVTVIEKNKKIPDLNQSSRNGGVIHAGLYYPKTIEPLKATLCVEGVKLLYAFCKKHAIPHKKTGKLILAVNKKEEKYLDFFLKIGTENGIKGMKIISGREVMKLEPNVQGVLSALFVPSTGSVALTPLVTTIKSLAEKKGAQFILGTEVTDIKAEKATVSITTKKARKIAVIKTDFLINAAGLYADTIAKLVNPDTTYQIIPARGELFQFDSSDRKNIRTSGAHLYQTPFFYNTETNEIIDVPANQIKKLLKTGAITKTLGSHLSPAFDEKGNKFVLRKTMTVGPLKTLGFGKEDYTTKKKTATDYINRVSYFFPNLKPSDLKPRYTGVMAVLKGKTDFVIEKDAKYPQCLNLVGMDSPAFTASLAIAKHVQNVFENGTM